MAIIQMRGDGALDNGGTSEGRWQEEVWFLKYFEGSTQVFGFEQLEG